MELNIKITKSNRNLN